MNRVFSILTILLISSSHIFAQVTAEKLAAFRESVLLKYNVYFTHADLTESGQLTLSATDKYQPLSIAGKKAMMDQLVRSWQESLVLVQNESKRELWVWDGDTGKALLLDRWDINATAVTKTATTASSKTALHPWFVYLGGQGQMDKNHEVNGAINTRIGFFLLRNRWDLAWTFSGGLLGNYDSEVPMTSRFSTGLMSKVYFPIKKYNISPNAGIDVSSTTYTSSEAAGNTYNRTVSLLAGISWYIGHGSLDIGFRIGDEFNTMIGYTYIPQFKNRKKK